MDSLEISDDRCWLSRAVFFRPYRNQPVKSGLGTRFSEDPRKSLLDQRLYFIELAVSRAVWRLP
jgi:hypothetical protein